MVLDPSMPALLESVRKVADGIDRYTDDVGGEPGRVAWPELFERNAEMKRLLSGLAVSDDIDAPYENTLSLEELRREVRRLWDREHALTEALRDLPAVPHWRVQYLLSSAAKWPDDHNVGKRMQREFGLDAIGPRSEPEGGAGLWSHIRAGVLAARSGIEIAKPTAE